MAFPNSTFIDPNLPLVSVFTDYGINERQVEPLVPKLAPAFSRSVISTIAEQIGKPQLVSAKTPIFQIYRQPNDWAAATISNNVTVGTDRVLTWSDPTFQSIRVGNMVQAKSGALGIVKSASAGTATIGFLSNPNGSTAFGANDFVIGELASDRGDVTDRDNRLSKSTFFTMPVPYQNIVSSISDTTTVNFSEANQFTYLKNINGTQYYALNKVTQMLGRLQQTYSIRMVGDIPANFNTSTPVGGSLIWQIKNQGGTTRALNAAITPTEFHDAIQQYINNGGYASKEVIIVAGSSYIQDLQRNVFRDFVTTAGNNNVLGGKEVKGLNIMSYYYSGFTFHLIMDEFLNNPNIWQSSTLFAGETVRSKSAIWMNAAPCPTENGGTLPFVSDYYYGVPDMIVTEVKGMTDMMGRPVKEGVNGKLASTVEVNWNKTTQFNNPAQCMFHYASA